mmetsp:Transcript_28317/g.66256  ORF Transcript_28317/g.66256 Transcript_28317/m.66256 type:complete len:215 (-) Transcript_28317:91-735(-)
MLHNPPDLLRVEACEGAGFPRLGHRHIGAAVRVRRRGGGGLVRLRVDGEGLDAAAAPVGGVPHARGDVDDEARPLLDLGEQLLQLRRRRLLAARRQLQHHVHHLHNVLDRQQLRQRLRAARRRGVLRAVGKLGHSWRLGGGARHLVCEGLHAPAARSIHGAPHARADVHHQAHLRDEALRLRLLPPAQQVEKVLDDSADALLLISCLGGGRLLR